MKFCKRYEAYMQARTANKLPALGLKKMKKTLKRCRRDFHAQHHRQDGEEGKCPGNCAVCDGTFFPSLLKEMSAVVGCFNQQAQKLLELHLATGLHKYVMWLKGKTQKNHGAMIQEGQDLVAYAIINSIAMRKILKKYDKIHYSKQGQAFKSKAFSMHIDILQSPWLCELMALHINMMEGNTKKKAVVELLDDCTLTFDKDDKPTLSCGLFDSMKIEVDLTCSICLETVFDPVALSCGHLFCYMCCCSAASVTIIDGLKSASSTAKCPLCRQEGVYSGAIHLDELKILLRQSCPEYWKRRQQVERVERLRQSKEHWESLSRAFVGI